ncbi:FecCD family ABC transporter permease [Salibacterium qingdaonense]|uniref:Iron complex transport system permease protein n=1 Tax=Salibacterium qingdaonense TaxID=266892 RepID=A0A1I4PNB5_9BACI|nr:iron ABC transporter permease [Salibacterium qingdaonense]SFM29154.1 iron complex transport system permease protein [Salibacterium qingdaonense]
MKRLGNAPLGTFSLKTRTNRVLLLLFLAAVAACMLGPSLGNTMLSPLEVIRAMAGDGEGANEFIVMNSRMPRTLVSILVGAALGVSGALLQGVVRNPLAAPDIIGVTGGASVAAVAFLTYTSGSVSIGWLPGAAVTGALVVASLTYSLAWKKGVTPIRLVLIGIGIAAVMSALTTFMIVVSSKVTASSAYLWLTGSIYGASWEDIFAMLPVVLVLTPAALLLAGSLNAQQFGDDTASGLGVRIQVHRFILLFISVVLAGTAVAAAGAIGFVGLIAPHIARTLIGRTFGPVIAASAFVGGLLLFGADLAARTIFYPVDVPAGVFTAAVGAPFFLFLLYRNRNHF